MKKFVKIKEKIKSFNKTLMIEGDKSLSIRWALLASQANGKSFSSNLLKSEDVLNTLNCLKKLGVKVKIFKNQCEITSNGLNSFNYNRNSAIKTKTITTAIVPQVTNLVKLFHVSLCS